MTTIAYRDGVLAADTLATWGNSRDGRTTKIVKCGQVLAGASGSLAGCQSFLDWVRGGMRGEHALPPEGEACWYGLVITPDDWVLTYGPRGWERTRNDMATLGSGANYASGAMSAGASAPEAVAIAILHDTKSGGDITVLRR